MDYHLDLNIMSVKLTIILRMEMILLITGTDFDDQMTRFGPEDPFSRKWTHFTRNNPIRPKWPHFA